jgi:hypothetical protein
MPQYPAPQPQAPNPPGGTGPRGPSFSNGPKGAPHRWPCSCRWCLDGSVAEQRG